MHNLRRTAWAACFATLILFGCTRSRAAESVRDGGTMNDVILQRLGKVVAGRQNPPRDGVDSIDGRPIVLWRGNAPAAVLYYRFRTHALGLDGEERIERLDEQPAEAGVGQKRGPFPLVCGSQWSLTGKPVEGEDSFDMGQIATADVNGDGVDELLLPRYDGAIGVYGVDRMLFEQPALQAPKGAGYRVKDSFTARLKGRDVVFFLLFLESKADTRKTDPQAIAKAEKYAILRVDKRGISRIPLPRVSVPTIRVHAVGAISRPRSAEIDEILVLFKAGESERKVYLSRQRGDGSAIAPPKEVYVHIDTSALTFKFLPDTAHAILADRNSAHLYFIRPDKATNWIADIDLHPLGGSPYSTTILHPVDPGTDPKMIVAVAKGGEEGFDSRAIYAINSEGNCFRPNPAGNTWQPTPSHEPFLQLTSPTKGHRLIGLLSQPGADILLAVYSREAELKSLTEEETMAAADRFLQPTLTEQLRKANLEFTPERFKELYSYSFSREERKRRGVTEQITTANAWRRLLPDSYQKALSMMKDDFNLAVTSHLNRTLLFRYPFNPEEYRNIDEYRVWLDGLKLAPDTVFEVVHRGEIAARFNVAGYIPHLLDQTTMGFPFDFRAGTSGATVVSPLDTTPSPELAKQPLGFYLVRLAGKAF